MYRIAIITASDKGARGEREDLSGPEIARLTSDAATVVSTQIIPDEREALARAMAGIADGGAADIIFTTGGTGFSPRDVTPEATLDVCERMAPGIPEAMRAESAKHTDRAMLSRAVAGIRGRTLIVNLPGSPKAVRECLTAILPGLWHGVDILIESAHDCGEPAREK